MRDEQSEHSPAEFPPLSDGWWTAGDGRLYPPADPLPPEPLPVTTARTRWWKRAVPVWGLALGVVVALAVGAAAGRASRGRDGNNGTTQLQTANATVSLLQRDVEAARNEAKSASD